MTCYLEEKVGQRGQGKVLAHWIKLFRCSRFATGSMIERSTRALDSPPSRLSRQIPSRLDVESVAAFGLFIRESPKGIFPFMGIETFGAQARSHTSAKT